MSSHTDGKTYSVAIFYPVGQLCETDTSLPRLSEQPKVEVEVVVVAVVVVVAAPKLLQRGGQSAASLRTKTLDLRGFDSSRIFILRVGFPGP